MNLVRKVVLGSALVAATLGGGAAGAVLIQGTSSAQTVDSTTATTAVAPSSSTDTQAPPRDGDHGGPHMANGITETELTGDAKTKVEAAAAKAVPGGTIERVETDAEGAKYEAHVRKADGSDVTVKMDADFNVTSIENGHA